jgi:hypothetical protein
MSSAAMITRIGELRKYRFLPVMESIIGVVRHAKNIMVRHPGGPAGGNPLMKTNSL